MKIQKLKAFACCAVALAMTVAFSPVAFAEVGSDDPTSNTIDIATNPDDSAADTAEDPTTDPAADPTPAKKVTYVNPKTLAGKTYTKGNYVYKVTKITASTVGKKLASTVEVCKYKGGKTASIPASVSLKVKYSKDKKTKAAKHVVSFKVTTVGAGAFNNAKGHKISKLTVGENVIYIGEKAFCGCKSLTKITYKGKDIGNKAKFGAKGKLKKSTMGKNAFKGVPRSCMAYTPSTTNWKQLQYKQGVRASMTYAGFKGIVY